jgi:tetratricopeptide (TPR) repeat protein
MTVAAASGGTDRQPYVGLRPFRREDGPEFFARESESAQLTALWQAGRVTVVSGPSGVGKTSLLQAGVVPRLRLMQADVLPIGRVSGVSAFPMAALPEHNPYTLALLSAWSPGDPATRLSGLTVHEFLGERGGRTDSHGDRRCTFAAIDQAEKLFSDIGRRDPYRQAFIEELAEALSGQPNLRLLLSIREDSLEDLAHYQQDLGNPVTFAVRPLTTAAAIDAVQKPIEQSGYSLAPGAAGQLVSNLRSPGPPAPAPPENYGRSTDHDVEPALLQAVCAGFWAALPRRVHRIGFDELSRYGDVAQLLAGFCARAVASVADQQGLSAAELRAWLQRTFTTELGTRGTACEGQTHTAAMPNAVPRALEDWHLLKAIRRSGLRWYELQHDCLIGPVRHMSEAAGRETGAHQASAEEYLRAAEASMADGDLALAERQAAAAVRETDETNLRLRAEAESVLGNVEHIRKNPAQAEARYRSAAALFEALQDTSAVARLLAAIGQSLLAQGRAAEAVEKLYAAIRRLPNDLTVQTELGRALWQQGQHAAAVAVLTGVLTVDGRSPDALRARGEILADLGEAEKALRDLDRVRRLRWPSAHAARALALATLRRPGAADEEIGTALTEAPDNGQVLLYAARVGALGGDRVMAANLARRAEAAANPALLPHQLEQARKLQRVGEAGPGEAGNSGAV